MNARRFSWSNCIGCHEAAKGGYRIGLNQSAGSSGCYAVRNFDPAYVSTGFMSATFNPRCPPIHVRSTPDSDHKFKASASDAKCHKLL
jgi:hypothetical protein